MVRRIIFGIACCLLGIAAGTEPLRAAVMLSAGSATVSVGDVVTIPISIAGATGLNSFQFDLAFTPSIVTVLSFDDSSTDFATAATSQGGALTGMTGFIDDMRGLLSGPADSMSGVLGAGLTGSGVLADVEFQALSPGTSPLNLSNVFLTDGGVPLSSPNGDFSLQNGEIIVEGTVPIPEPSALPVVITALVVLGLLHRCRGHCRRAFRA